MYAETDLNININKNIYTNGGYKMEPEKRANLGVMKEEVVFNKFLAF